MSDKFKTYDFEDAVYDDVVAKLGEPATVEEFDLVPGMSEFRIELYNFYSDDVLETAPPRIVEATWHVSAEDRLTVWFVRDGDEKRYLHRASWNVGDDF